MARKVISESGTAQIAGASNRAVDPGDRSAYFTRENGALLRYRYDTESVEQGHRCLTDKSPLLALCLLITAAERLLRIAPACGLLSAAPPGLR